MELRKGSVVFTPKGRGVVTDRDAGFGESLVQLDSGSELDTSHGEWFPDGVLAVAGFRPAAMVWSGPRLVPARDLLPR